MAAAQGDAHVERLRAMPLFATCTSREVERLAALTTPVRLPAGAPLCTAGRLARECLVVLEGEAITAGDGRCGFGGSRRPPSWASYDRAP